MANEQISLPYLLLILLVSGLVIRYLFFSPSPSQQRQPLDSVLRTREAAVDRIQQMFPQASRRSILWDLQRNGGNIQVTTERILAGRLETVSYIYPVSFDIAPFQILSLVLSCSLLIQLWLFD
jgi:coupling of ubiquitin conjugation to ER degradation protein 1